VHAGSVEALLGIGDFSRMTFLSVKTLHRHHEIGLLPPAEIDRESGYRRYALAQVPTAQVIRRLREGRRRCAEKCPMGVCTIAFAIRWLTCEAGASAQMNCACGSEASNGRENVNLVRLSRSAR
jgi:hypothetical protein